MRVVRQSKDESECKITEVIRWVYHQEADCADIVQRRRKENREAQRNYRRRQVERLNQLTEEMVSMRLEHDTLLSVVVLCASDDMY